jgi:hypothetical protein
MSNGLVYGLYQNYYLKPLLVDSTGAPLVSGYLGNPLFNYANTLRFYWEDTNLTAGVNTHDFGALLAHQLCFITAIWFRYNSTISTNHIRWSINDGVNDYPFIDQLAPVANTGYSFQTNIPYKANEHLICTVTAAAAGNDIFTSVLGWMMNYP